MSAESLGKDRFYSRSGEIKDCLIPYVVSEHTCLGFYRAFCDRFGVDPTGGDSDWGPVEVWLPEGRMRWDACLAAIEYSDMRLIIHENPAFLASFAVSHAEIEGEDEQFAQFPEPQVAAGYRPKLPASLIQPRSFRTVWTLISDMHHGADEKHGNVSLFRRHRVNDPLTGATSYVPFVSGNAVRGLMRDMVMGRWLGLLGLKSTDVQPFRAHALFAGGTQEKGADSAKVDNEIRTQVREICPPWDLLAGCIEQQIMGGRARINDATLVCRENAWKTHELVQPGVQVDEWAAMLPEACTMTKLRLETRQKHADIVESEGTQMLVNTELLIQGYQMVHTMQLWGIDGVSQVTQACFADLLEDFQQTGFVGAKNSHGMGGIAFDPYVPGPGTPELPDPTVYLEFVEANRDRAIEWLMSPKKRADDGGKAGKRPAKRSKKTAEEAEETDALHEAGAL